MKGARFLMPEARLRERIVRWEDPLATLASIRDLSGLEILHGLIDGSIPQPPYALLLGVRVAEAEAGRVVFEAEPGEEHYNPGGLVHGGFAMSLLDFALGSAINSTLPAGFISATTDMHARLVRPMTKDTGTIRCEAQVVSKTRSLATADARIVDASGKLLATGTTACAIRSTEPRL